MLEICRISDHKETKLKFPYDYNHKYINDIEYKLCSDCNEWHPMNEEYFYKNKSSPDGFNPYCKNATKNKYIVWRQENYEHYLDGQRKRNLEPPMKAAKRRYNQTDKKKQKQLEWQRENKDKIKIYNDHRKQHKEHDITDEEWFACLDYFNNTCAYCGLSELIQIEIYNEQFHKEHVNHNGSNYIDNCVPSCTKCNASKNDSEFNDWYNDKNELFSKRRLNKIINWMTNKCFTI